MQSWPRATSAAAARRRQRAAPGARGAPAAAPRRWHWQRCLGELELQAR